MAGFLQQLKALHTLLVDLTSQGHSVELVERKHVQRLIDQAATFSLQPHELSQAFDVLKSAPLSHESKGKLETLAVDISASDGAAKQTGKRARQQDFTQLGNYFTSIDN